MASGVVPVIVLRAARLVRRAAIVVLSPRRRWADQLRETTAQLLGFAPTLIDGASVWDVRSIVG